MAGGGVIAWIWFQEYQISKLQRVADYAEATRLTVRNLSIYEKVLGPNSALLPASVQDPSDILVQ